MLFYHFYIRHVLRSYSIYWNKVCYVLIWKLFSVIINVWIISGKVSWGYQKWNVNSCLTSRQNKCAFLNLFKCHKNLRLKFVNLKASRKLQMFLHSQSNHAFLNFKNILPFNVQKQGCILIFSMYTTYILVIIQK